MAFPIPQLVERAALNVHRILVSSFPPIDLFEDVATSNEFKTAINYQDISFDRMLPNNFEREYFRQVEGV